jgi:hypothetical protein
MTDQEQIAKMARQKAEAAFLGEFYAGWNAAIRTMQAMAQSQGWWFPESALKLQVRQDD